MKNGIIVEPSMAMGKGMAKRIIVCTLLAVFMNCQPLALFLGSMVPSIASHADRSEPGDRSGAFLPQEWGPRKTNLQAVRLISEPALNATAVIEHKRVLPEPDGDGPLAASGARPAPSPEYLNNLTIRC
jgi:hypothetical protein